MFNHQISKYIFNLHLDIINNVKFDLVKESELFGPKLNIVILWNGVQTLCFENIHVHASRLLGHVVLQKCET